MMIVTKIIGAVVAKTAIALDMPILYTYGQSLQILEELKRKNDVQGVKYPLFAVYQPFPVRRGTGIYGRAVIRRISIACLTNLQDDTPTRSTKTFEPIIYPVYYEFLRQLTQHPNINDRVTDYVLHEYYEVPGIAPVEGITDYVDQLILNNLELNLSQKKSC